MASVKIVTSSACFEDYQEELLLYLARRFGSIAFAERVSRETKRRVEESDILPLVGNPRVYLSSYAFSLGIQFLQEEYINTRSQQASLQ